MKDPEKSRADSAARSKANYEKDVEASRTLRRQRYVIICAGMSFLLQNIAFNCKAKSVLHGLSLHIQWLVMWQSCAFMLPWLIHSHETVNSQLCDHFYVVLKFL